MASPTRHNRIVPTGRAMADQSRSNLRLGPGSKNTSSTAAKQVNPKSSIRSIAGRSYKGPDLGGGGG